MSDRKASIYCCECAADVDAVLITGAQAYPHRPDLKSLPFWQCPECSGFVGCHHKTKDRLRPLGVIPSRAMKPLRQRVHRLIDPLWRRHGWKRKDVYAAMARVTGVGRFHTAELRSVEECERAIEAALAVSRHHGGQIDHIAGLGGDHS